MHEKAFEVRYTELNPDDEYDVSFELTEEAEDALFTGLANMLREHASDGIFYKELIHLYKKLSEQQESHPPWIETDDIDGRTYDLHITSSDYRLLSKIVGEQLQNVLRPDGAQRYRELIDAWESITDQMLVTDEQPQFRNERLHTFYTEDE